MVKEGNMYSDSVLQWNIFVGCEFDCSYCKKSFQAQMRRQIHNCEKCGNYIPHFHPERLYKKLPKTEGDEFIWVGSSGDISFIEESYMMLILEKIETNPDKTFFFQTKDPQWFDKWQFPENTLIGITLESDIHYPEITKAPTPWKRAIAFYFVEHPRKVITIEPILKFQEKKLLSWIRDIRPERVYIGFDSKKNNLPEPTLKEVEKLIFEMEKLEIKIKRKLIRKGWDEI